MTQLGKQPYLETFDWARAAFIDAHGRFQSSLTLASPEKMWISLGETLFWIAAIDDTYESVAKKKGRMKDYKDYRDSDRYGRAVTGLTIPRNSVVHALGDVVVKRTDASSHEWQPTFKALGAMGLTQPQGAKALEVFQESASRPIRYQIRDANYFFIREKDTLDQFII